MKDTSPATTNAKPLATTRGPKTATGDALAAAFASKVMSASKTATACLNATVLGLNRPRVVW